MIKLLKYHGSRFGKESGCVFFAFKFGEGGTLHDRLVDSQRGPITYLNLLNWMVDGGKGLNVLHSMIVRHGDIKPQNIFISGDGRSAKLGDVGHSTILASIQNSMQRGRSSMVRGGTPVYTDPDALRGERPTLAQDVYSFGMTLLQVITGSTVENLNRSFKTLKSWHPGNDEKVLKVNKRQGAERFPDELFVQLALLAQDCISELIGSDPDTEPGEETAGGIRPSMSDVLDRLNDILSNQILLSEA